MLVQTLGKGFGEAISEGFQEDVRVIVLVGLKASEVRLDSVDANRKATDPVAVVAYEIAQAHAGAAFALRNLLPQEGEPDMLLGLDHMNDHVVAFTAARPQPGNTARGQPLFLDQLFQHRLSVDPKSTRSFANDLVGQDGWIIPVQFPRTEEWCPVDDIGKIGQIPCLEHMHPRRFRRGGAQVHIGDERVGARICQ